METIKQLQIALGVLLTALLLLIACGAVLLFTYKPGAETVAQAPGPNTPPTEAAPAQPAALDAVAQQGQTIFNNNCAACHAVTGEVVVGPGLKGVTQRRPEAWLVSWVKNPQKMIDGGDAYAVEIYNKFNKQQMPSFPLPDEEIKAIFKYVEASGGQ